VRDGKQTILSSIIILQLKVSASLLLSRQLGLLGGRDGKQTILSPMTIL